MPFLRAQREQGEAEGDEGFRRDEHERVDEDQELKVCLLIDSSYPAPLYLSSILLTLLREGRNAGQRRLYAEHRPGRRIHLIRHVAQPVYHARETFRLPGRCYPAGLDEVWSGK